MAVDGGVDYLAEPAKPLAQRRQQTHASTVPETPRVTRRASVRAAAPSPVAETAAPKSSETAPAGPAPRRAPTSPAELYLEQRRRLVASARGRVLALRRLTKYRRANEELQNAFLALERHLPPGANAPDLVFADERQSPEARLTMGWGSPSLSQVLPVSSTGISAVALSCFAIAARPGALLRIHLCSVEDQRVIDRWTVPLAKLENGWNMLALTRALVGPTRTLRLTLDLDGQADSAVSLHLGTAQPAELFRVQNAATEAQIVDSGLSMRIWCGDPYAAGAGQPNTIPADAQRETAGGHYEPLSPRLLAAVEQVNGEDIRMSFDPVSFSAYRAAVACHPPARGVTTASVPLPPACLVTAFSADLEVGNEKSRPVEFAVALAADAKRARELLAGAAPRDDEALSPWTPAAYGAPATLAASRRSAPRQVAAFFATRMQQPGNNDFAWARFRNVAIVAVSK